jgi:hypothetical protein
MAQAVSHRPVTSKTRVHVLCGYELDSAHSKHPLAGSGKIGNEPLNSAKGEKFIGQPTEYQLLKNSAP